MQKGAGTSCQPLLQRCVTCCHAGIRGLVNCLHVLGIIRILLDARKVMATEGHPGNATDCTPGCTEVSRIPGATLATSRYGCAPTRTPCWQSPGDIHFMGQIGAFSVM